MESDHGYIKDALSRQYCRNIGTELAFPHTDDPQICPSRSARGFKRERGMTHCLVCYKQKHAHDLWRGYMTIMYMVWWPFPHLPELDLDPVLRK